MTSESSTIATSRLTAADDPELGFGLSEVKSDRKVQSKLVVNAQALETTRNETRMNDIQRESFISQKLKVYKPVAPSLRARLTISLSADVRRN